MTNNSAFWVQEQEKKTIHKLHNEKHNRINREESLTGNTWSWKAAQREMSQVLCMPSQDRVAHRMVCVWKKLCETAAQTEDRFCFQAALALVSPPLKWKTNNKHKFENQEVFFLVACHFYSDQCFHVRFNLCYYPMWPNTSLLNSTFLPYLSLWLNGAAWLFLCFLNFGLKIIKMTVQISEYFARIL